MIKNYFKITWRNLVRNKTYSFINIAGLTIGMASAMLIFLWTQNEVSHDRFHAKIDRTYLMNNRGEYNGEVNAWNNTSKPMGLAIKKDYPEVEDVVRVNYSGANFLISSGDKHFSIHGDFVDEGFLNMFSFPLLKGNAGTALNSVSNIVLTEQLAKKLFGNDDPMGKTVRVDSVDYLTVTGVLKDLPANTSFEFEYLLPWAYATKVKIDDNYWGNNSVLTFVLLKPGASLDAFNKKVSNIIIDHTNGTEKVHAFAQPYKDAWLYSKVENGDYTGGRINQVRMYIIIAALILLIACINFTNLSTARSEKRAKEVGIRKTVGAQKYSLILQFISESILLSFAAGIIAICIVQLTLPSFNTIVGKKLFVDFSEPLFWLYTILFVLFTGMIAGIYPAFYLSSFQPIKVLKGTFKSSSALVTPRKVLVVLQFTFAIALIICTIVVETQLKYAQNRDVGYSRNNLAFIIMFGDANKNAALIKQDLLKSKAATAVALTSSPMTEQWSGSNGFTWTGSKINSQEKVDFTIYSADNEFSNAMGLKILQGRDIDIINYKTDSSAVLLNETSVKVMGLKDPIGQTISNNGLKLHVIGVVKNFILENPYNPVSPMIIAGPSFGYNVMNFRLNPSPTIASSLAKVEKVFKEYNPQYPFNCRFYDKEYAAKFADEQKAGTLAALFAVLTIFISCLGLFGLATYMAENRTKEIGIRKVLGASVTSITGMLSKEFLKLVIVSFIIASPIAWMIMHNWLSNYEYRIKIEWWVFAIAGILSLVIALATVSFQAIKAARSNPVKSLRTE